MSHRGLYGCNFAFPTETWNDTKSNQWNIIATNPYLKQESSTMVAAIPTMDMDAPT